jgi:hypothetical protein
MRRRVLVIGLDGGSFNLLANKKKHNNEFVVEFVNGKHSTMETITENTS